MIVTTRRVVYPLLYLASALLLAALARFALAGSMTRYWADDFCYSAVMAAGGVLRGPLDWFGSSGNRFSTIYLVGLQDLLGQGAIRLFPLFLILALCAAWTVLVKAILFTAGQLRLRWIEAVPFTVVQVFFLVLLAPDRLQGLYWRMGGLHYTFPLALLLLLLALVFTPGKALRIPLAFGLAFFAGGFSETYAALQTGVFLLLLMGEIVLRRFGRPVPRGTSWAGLAGSLAAIGLMLLSPSNAWRQAALPPPDSLGQFMVVLWRYTFDFVFDTLRGAPLPLWMAILLSTATAYLLRPNDGANASRTVLFRTPWKWLVAALLCLAGGVVLSACAIAPSVYAGLQFPAGRALMPARFALLAGLAGACVCLAAWIRQVSVLERRAVPLLLTILLAGSFYTARHLSRPLPEQAEMTIWAERWDERDALIRERRDAGEIDLVIAEVEVVRGLEDIGPDADHWVNRCAAIYYGVETITATTEP